MFNFNIRLKFSLLLLFVGETGHLGMQIQSEQEFSQLYQIFADEILGSGQFGTVYGGKSILLQLVFRYFIIIV